MIEGWETETAPLTSRELLMSKWVAKGLEDKRGRSKAVTNKTMRAFFLQRFDETVSEARIRKVIHYLTTSGIVPLLVASSKGYYRASAPEDVQRYIRSLRGRAAAIERKAKALEDQLADHLKDGQLFKQRTASAKT